MVFFHLIWVFFTPEHVISILPHGHNNGNIGQACDKNRLLHGWGCDMVFITSGCVISRTSERSERVSDIIQTRAIKTISHPQP